CAANVEVTHTLAGPFAVAKDAALMETAIRAAFERLGESRLALELLTWENEGNCFVPVSKLNQMRRELLRELEAGIAVERDARVSEIIASAKHGSKNSFQIQPRSGCHAFGDPDGAHATADCHPESMPKRQGSHAFGVVVGASTSPRGIPESMAPA